MIIVTGTAKLRMNYAVELDMTVEEFEAMSQRAQDELLDDTIDWMDACRSADLDDIDVDDIEELEDPEPTESA